MAIESERRGREQRLRIGGEIRAMRERRGWTRTDLAARAGLGRMVVGRVERGLTNLDLDALQRIGAAMDRPLVVTFGRDLHEQPLDAGHLAIQELVLRLAAAAGYESTFEFPTRPVEPWRSIDVCLTSPAFGAVVIVECWNSIGDVGAAARATDRKRSDMAALVAARGEPERQVASLWVVRATARNRRLVATYPQVFATRFPGSSRRWVQALLGAVEPPSQPGLVWCDVGATRLFEWRRESSDPVLHSAPHGRDREE